MTSPRDVKCLRCGAAKGADCIALDGCRFYGTYHRERIISADGLQETLERFGGGGDE